MSIFALDTTGCPFDYRYRTITKAVAKIDESVRRNLLSLRLLIGRSICRYVTIDVTSIDLNAIGGPTSNLSSLRNFKP